MTFDPEAIMPHAAKIKVIGVGGGGGNAVNTMIRSALDGVDFVTCNTDVQALRFSLAPHKIQIGKELTRGLGAGADPDIGRDAALEDRQEIQEILRGADMVFITAGMGGGTGTGAAAVVAQLARELGALTVAVVTKPFAFEGKRRRRHADSGIARLRESVDTLITIPNQRLLQVSSPDLSMIDAFKMADEVLVNAVRGISDIINIPGTVNVDFADVKTVMSCMGQALMGIGAARGEGRAAQAARIAICSPLLEDIDIEGATGILINITAGTSIRLHEINEACLVIQEAAHEDANIIFGAVIDESLGDEIRVTVIATGFPVDKEEVDPTPPRGRSVVSPYGTRPTMTAGAGLQAAGTPPSPAAAPARVETPRTPVASEPPPAVHEEAPRVAAAPVPAAAPVVEPESAPLAVAGSAANLVTQSPAGGSALQAEAKQSGPFDLTQELSTPEPAFDAALEETPAAPAFSRTNPVLDLGTLDAKDEARELARWTLGAFDIEELGLKSEIPSLAEPKSEGLPLAADLGEGTAETLVNGGNEDQLGDAYEGNGEAPELGTPQAPAWASEMSSIEQTGEVRIEGARLYADPQEEFAGALARTMAEASLADTLFDSGLAQATTEGEGDLRLAGLAADPLTAPAADGRPGATKEPAPLENFFQGSSELVASDIDRKIDEALELAERMRTPKSSLELDDLDIPAFLRNGMKDLPLG